SKEGTNDMAYNRCIGTRYCSNNCPYKVRRFNYFDYATKEFKGKYAGQTVIEGIAEPNPQMVPPRLREKISEVRTMQYNPHVSVRSRGVMEKCTYCIQRVNQARVETKIDGFERIPDGYVTTACQQACPSEAIIFGDIYDNDANNGAGSLVSQAKRDGRTYQMLGYLNARPRTTYMVRLRNPNPTVRKPN
ncbi:MAG: 4Fe-4S dicluster domain-containing protein, partial [Planctomycetales bacterium]|nr:4Fe-4S dicluster domain-containing protein [Planctomycetales bacterium]